MYNSVVKAEIGRSLPPICAMSCCSIDCHAHCACALSAVLVCGVTLLTVLLCQQTKTSKTNPIVFKFWPQSTEVHKKEVKIHCNEWIYRNHFKLCFLKTCHLSV